MKTKLLKLTFTSILGLLVLFLSGCYTQLGSVKDSSGTEEITSSPEQQTDASYTNQTGATEEYYGYDDYTWEYRPRVGFSYYYPSIWPTDIFAAAYANPWAYDYYPGYDLGYNGAGYLNYGYPQYNSPFYKYPPPSYYWPGYTSGLGYSVNRRLGNSGQTSTNTGNREIGNTRNDAPSVDMNTSLPTGARVGTPAGAGAPARGTTTPGDNSRTIGNQRASSTSPGAAGSSSSRGGNTRGTTQGRYTPPPITNTPASSNPPSSSNTGGSQQAATPTYTPPPTAAPITPPATSSPPANSSPNGGRRGGSSRGDPP